MTKNRKNAFWNFIDNLAGDKVVWMIVLLLILFSVVCIFSSTTGMTKANFTRLDILAGQLKIVGLGMVCILFCYLVIRDVKWYKRVAPLGLLLSLAALVFVLARVRISDSFRADTINGAWRVIKIGSKQIHIFELIKVAMVLYLAWAIETYEKKGFHLTNKLAEVPHLGWLGKPLTQRILFIYLPVLAVCGCIAFLGSGSSTVFIFGISFMTIFVSGLWYGKIKKVLLYGFLALALGGTLLVATDGKVLKVLGKYETWTSRVKGTGSSEEIFENSKKKSAAWYNALDDLRQTYSAKIAVHEGGFIGKGPGQSTQRYIVPVMYEDYMYAFVIEEYGLLGGIALLILYLSLLARGSIIVKHCNDRFAQIVVAGLVLLITGQALLHILVNVGLLPLTGQTLPMISHGATSFVAFSIAFGIMLSISRIAKKSLEKETKNAEPIISIKPEVESSLDDLDAAEDDIIENI
jgi:cell division protein FtsW